MSASFNDRGSVTNEHIEMFKALCTDDVAEYNREHFRISGKTFFPKPVQKPHPPIWVGGRSRAVLRRVARLGDGWLPIGLTPAELADETQLLRTLCERSARGAESVTIALILQLSPGSPKRGPDGSRTPLTGEVDEMLSDLRRYEEAGLEPLVLSIPSGDGDRTIESVTRFADEVVQKL